MREVYQCRDLSGALVWACLSAIALFLIGELSNSTLRTLCMGTFIYGLYAAFSALVGIRISGTSMHCRAPISRYLPALPWVPIKINLREIHSLTAAGLACGYEVVVLTTIDGDIVQLIPNRDARLKLFAAVEAENSMVKLYKTYS